MKTLDRCENAFHLDCTSKKNKKQTQCIFNSVAILCFFFISVHDSNEIMDMWTGF